MSKNIIGVMDSGVGGLTVAKEIRNRLPGEDVVYFGDSKNCPYGNRSKEEILELSIKMIEFLINKGANCVAIACNTISTLIDEIRPHFDIPIVSIVECASKAVAQNNIKSAGLIATCFTVNSGCYQKLIGQTAPQCTVTARGSENLANLVDLGTFNKTDIENEIKLCVDEILEKSDIESLILGCTHYPIVEENFKNIYPNLNLLNPAVAQCEEVKRILESGNGLSDGTGSFNLYTTGKTENYVKVIDRLSIKQPDSLNTVTL